MAKFYGGKTVLQLEGTPVAYLVSIDGPDMSVGTADATELGSTSMQHVPTIPDYGSFSGVLNIDFENATHTALFDLIATPAVSNWTVVYSDSDSTSRDFQGSLTKLKLSGFEPSASNLARAEFEIKLNNWDV